VINFGINLSSTLIWFEQIKVTYNKMNGKYAALSKKRLKFYENNFLISLRIRFVLLFIFSFFHYYSVVSDLTDQLNRI